MTLAVSLGELILAAAACLSARSASYGGRFPGFFLVEDYSWVDRFGIRYTLGMDGISLLMVLLTAFLTLLAVLFSRNTIVERVGPFYALLLMAASGITGVFLSLDLFLFYLFWELMLIPMFFLICSWGEGRRVAAALRFFLYTMSGSLLMLLAIIGLYLAHAGATGVASFALADLLRTPLDTGLSCWLFAAFVLAFAVKSPILPLHGWLPDAYTAAPTPAVIILAGLMAKTGAYGLLRFAFPLFPGAASVFSPLLCWLGAGGLLYASWVAFAQTDMKRLLAYSSFGHMGILVFGIAAWNPVSLSGSVIQMVNHGITTGALFLMAGMLEERRGNRDTGSFGGLWGRIPCLAAFFLLFSLANLGLPGLNNFVGEFLILAGAFRGYPIAAAAAFCGILLVLVYMLRLVQKLLFGQETASGTITDLSPRELGLLVSLALVVIFFGIYPAPALDLIRIPVALLTGGKGVMP
jgi:NADH-quinone oxidoreductase subunit M